MSIRSWWSGREKAKPKSDRKKDAPANGEAAPKPASPKKGKKPGKVRFPARMSKGESLTVMKKSGWAPGTIFDVGVATGTPGLYGIFDDVRYVLIDPVAEVEPFMKQCCDEYPGSIYYVVGASDRDASAQISVSAGYSGSSMHKKPGPESREIPTRSLDSIVAEQGDLPTPFLLKLDIEGHELRALEGAQQTLEKTDVVIAEISLWNDRKRETGGATLEDVFSHLHARGFVLYDVVDIGYRPSDGAMGLFDAVFVRGDCKIRELLAYRTKEQRAEINAHKAAKYARAKSELADD